MKLNTIENRQATNLVINSRIASLTLFSQSEILEQIGRTRLSMFLTAFTDELNAAGIELPLADEGASLCFSTVAEIFAGALVRFPIQLSSRVTALPVTCDGSCDG